MGLFTGKSCPFPLINRRVELLCLVAETILTPRSYYNLLQSFKRSSWWSKLSDVEKFQIEKSVDTATSSTDYNKLVFSKALLSDEKDSKQVDLAKYHEYKLEAIMASEEILTPY
jgi:hypothetical protein